MSEIIETNNMPYKYIQTPDGYFNLEHLHSTTPLDKDKLHKYYDSNVDSLMAALGYEGKYFCINTYPRLGRCIEQRADVKPEKIPGGALAYKLVLACGGVRSVTYVDAELFEVNIANKFACKKLYYTLFNQD